MERRDSINWKVKVYNKLPREVQRTANNLRLLPNYLTWYLNPKGRAHAIKVLSKLQNRYIGYRCVVIGNGPSLNRMDLSILEGEFTFGLNRIYLLFDELGFETTFLVAINGFVMHQYAEELKKINILKFFNWIHRTPYDVNEKSVFLCSRPGNKITGQVMDGYLSGGGTVTNLALELAYFMGFSEVILIGVDHSYAAKGAPGEAVVSNALDQNHFSPDYFGPGAIWQLPNYLAMEMGYRAVKDLYDTHGRTIVDATLGGKLQVFNKVNFVDYLSKSVYLSKSPAETKNHAIPNLE